MLCDLVERTSPFHPKIKNDLASFGIHRRSVRQQFVPVDIEAFTEHVQYRSERHLNSSMFGICAVGVDVPDRLGLILRHGDILRK
ncbi:hypothetical protein D7S92_22345 [Burkholderia contaminans]|nr:hypothetical protein [Burkholderia contaminans]MBA9908063.1 hypothetical protein [Burkholderia contaminans]